MNITEAILLIIIFIGIILEIKFSPRLDIISNEKSQQLILWYSIKSKYGKNFVLRECIVLFKY